MREDAGASRSVQPGEHAVHGGVRAGERQGVPDQRLRGEAGQGKKEAAVERALRVPVAACQLARVAEGQRAGHLGARRARTSSPRCAGGHLRGCSAKPGDADRRGMLEGRPRFLTSDAAWPQSEQRPMTASPRARPSSAGPTTGTTTLTADSGTADALNGSGATTSSPSTIPLTAETPSSRPSGAAR